LHTAFLWLLITASPAAPDTLVVCPPEFRPALRTWEGYRRHQGHHILVIDPPSDAARLKAAVRQVAQTGRLKRVVLIGDVPTASTVAPPNGPTIATNYVRASINTRWGSEPTIASDAPFADIDGDGAPDVAIGRIAADSAEELAAYVDKIIRYEESAGGDWQRRLNVVVGAGGFGAVTDAIIEAAGRHVIQQTVPPDYEVCQTRASMPQTAAYGAQVHSRLRDQLNGGGLAWVYLGHGLPTRLDCMPAAEGAAPLLSVADVGGLRCGLRTPLAVLVACYTGAIDAPGDCLAEELSLAAEGPVAVIAATRVTMPYGNTVLGYELLRACFQEPQLDVGDLLLAAQQRTKGEADDELRKQLDAICRGLSPPPVDLAAERSEHVLMYQLLGDPLMRLRRAPVPWARNESNEARIK
jgi:hypothetical protein